MNEEWFKKWLASWTGGDATELLSFYHESLFYRDPFAKAGISGKAAFSEYAGKLLAKNPDWVWSLVELFNDGEGRYCLKWKAQIGEMETHGLDIVEIRDEKIIRNEVFFNLGDLSP